MQLNLNHKTIVLYNLVKQKPPVSSHGSISVEETVTKMNFYESDSDRFNVDTKSTTLSTCGARWCRGMFGALQSEGCGFESTSSHRVGTLGKSFTRNCS